MKMGNIVPSAGIEPTSLAFWTNVQPLHPTVTTMPTPTCLCSSLPQVCADYYIHPPWNCKSFNAYNTMALHIYRVGSTTIQYIACVGSWS